MRLTSKGSTSRLPRERGEEKRPDPEIQSRSSAPTTVLEGSAGIKNRSSLAPKAPSQSVWCGPRASRASRGSSRRGRSPRAVRRLPKARQSAYAYRCGSSLVSGRATAGVSAGLARLPSSTTGFCQPENSREKSFPLPKRKIAKKGLTFETALASPSSQEGRRQRRRRRRRRRRARSHRSFWSRLLRLIMDTWQAKWKPPR